MFCNCPVVRNNRMHALRAFYCLELKETDGQAVSDDSLFLYQWRKRMEEYRGELLAPAGTMDCLKAAIAAGADAVYLGGQRFGARAFAGNFSREELLEGLSLAHLWNRKIYLTVNTLTKQDELSGLCDWIAPFYEAGLDGVIVQDMGVLEKLRKNFPGMELHASTQMTVTESRSALFLKSLGVCRIVPARELSLEEIRLLKEQTGLAMEVFIHGALCYCYSGQCLFSSFLGGRSGNRGRCAQPCRQPYTVHCPYKRQKSAERTGTNHGTGLHLPDTDQPATASSHTVP